MEGKPIALGEFPLPPPVVIVVGNNIDASAMPLTYERNRFVVDMMRHYACPDFCSSESGSATDEMLSNVFEWIAAPLPVVGVKEMMGYHNGAYLNYLSLRETLSDVDERASSAKRSRAEEIQPPLSRRTLTPPHPPLRILPDLVPVAADEGYGLTGDNTPFLGMWRTIQATVSGTLLAVRLLTERGRFVAIHWFGGRHHAREQTAAGFCFVNDVVLGVLELKKSLPLPRNRVLVVDLDSHHGDGTQMAFLSDNSVLTLSIHAHGVGIFPGTGGLEEIGVGLGRGFTMNVPLPEGATDALAVPLIYRAICTAFRKLNDDLGAIVIVCGSDALSGDPLGALNITVGGMQTIVRTLLKEAAARSLKVLLLGAGGYVDATCARLAGVVTKDVLSCAAAVRRGSTDYFSNSANVMKDFSVHVPEDCEHFTRFGPSFLMHGLPPARVAKVRQLPHESPLFIRMQRVAERRALQLSRKKDEDEDEDDEDSTDEDDTDDDDDDEEDDEAEEEEDEGDEEDEEEDEDEEDEDEEDEDEEEECEDDDEDDDDV